MSVIFATAILLRLCIFDQRGGDHDAYKMAVADFRKGINPYEYTVRSYQEETLKHGYAYMPTLLYIQSFLENFNGFFRLDAPTTHLWKIPVLLADIGIGILILLILKKQNFSKQISLFGLIFWFINPYFFMRFEYTNYESLPIFFLLLSLLYVGKKDFLSGILFALSISLKTFPVILLSLMIVKSKNLKLFVLGGLLTGLVLSAPFLTSTDNFSLMLNGSFFVHGERGIQGRPLFSFISYYTQNFGLSFLQSEFSKIYTFIALIGAQVVPLYLHFKKKTSNIWILALSSFAVYYLFTPVLNRTHFIWGLPFIYIAVANSFSNNLKKHILTTSIFYISLCFYYFLWTKGLKNPLEFGGAVWIDPVFQNRPTFPLIKEMFVKAVMWKRQLF